MLNEYWALSRLKTKRFDAPSQKYIHRLQLKQTKVTMFDEYVDEKKILVNKIYCFSSFYSVAFIKQWNIGLFSANAYVFGASFIY